MSGLAPTWGELGGILAGVTTLLFGIGAGVRWALGWKARSENSRAHKLQIWHDELQAKELRLDTEREAEILNIRRELLQMKREHSALFNAYHLLAGALSMADPQNVALRMADDLLRTIFRVDADTPADMTNLAGQIQ